MGQTIDIREYLDLIIKRKKIIISIIIIFMLCGGALQYLHGKSYVPTYTSTVSVKININKNTQKNSSKNTSDENPEVTDAEATDTESTNAEEADTQAANTETEPVQTTADVYNSSLQSSSINQDIGSKYSSLATSKRAMLDLKARLNLQLNPEAISGNITVTPGENLTEFLDISVTNTDAKLAKKIAEQMPDVFNSELMRVIGLDCVETLYDASEPIQNPKPAEKTFIKFTLVGIVLAIFVVLLLECLDNKVVTPDDVEEYWGLPVIGVVPFEKENIKGKTIKTKA